MGTTMAFSSSLQAQKRHMVSFTNSSKETPAAPAGVRSSAWWVQEPLLSPTSASPPSGTAVSPFNSSWPLVSRPLIIWLGIQVRHTVISWPILPQRVLFVGCKTVFLLTILSLSTLRSKVISWSKKKKFKELKENVYLLKEMVFLLLPSPYLAHHCFELLHLKCKSLPGLNIFGPTPRPPT